MLNWIAWNKTDGIKKDLVLTCKGWYAIKPKQPTTSYDQLHSVLVQVSTREGALLFNKNVKIGVVDW